jgi:hypothetical protein
MRTYNANFMPARGMLSIAEIHLGKVAEGMRLLQEVMEASPDDAHRHRHRRELAIAHLLARRCRRSSARGGEAPQRDARHEAQHAGAGGPARSDRRDRSCERARHDPDGRNA